MNKRRKVLITITYNEMGIIIDAKAEEVAQPNLQSTCNELVTDCISRQAAIDAVGHSPIIEVQPAYMLIDKADVLKNIVMLPSAQPETARRIVGKSRNGMTLWYQCEMCNEPVDAQDNFCRGCGRRLTDE